MRPGRLPTDHSAERLARRALRQKNSPESVAKRAKQKDTPTGFSYGLKNERGNR